MGKVPQLVYVSATPAQFEIDNSTVGNTGYVPHKRERIGDAETVPAMVPGTKRVARISGSDQPIEAFDVTSKGKALIVEQIIRPTGLLDPIVTLKPLKGQIDETIELCRQRIEKGERVLVTTLTKRTAEDLTDYLRNLDLKVRYLHSEIDAIERVEILRSLRAGEFDILVGINLLREGLDLPEVSLVCILDADKEGFLRSETSLLQTAGRAARHVNGEVVLFADNITTSIQSLINISAYRRERQMAYNEKHGITPQSVKRAVQQSLHTIYSARQVEEGIVKEDAGGYAVNEVIHELEAEMAEAASRLEYERAALLRDQIRELKKQAGIGDSTQLPQKKVKYGGKRGRKSNAPAS